VTLADATRNATLRVALGEYDIGFEQPEASLDRAAICVARAAAGGARLVLLPEMCATGFTMNPEEWAESEDGTTYTRLAEIAHRHDVWIIAGVATRRANEFFNVAAVFDPEGTFVASYAKQRLFAYGEEHEHYTAGSAPVIVDIDGVRVSPFVCYDLRFPELFRAVAPSVDLITVIANWPAARRPHWDALLPARAIENLTYVAGVNRTGNGGSLSYTGGSVGYDPWGVPTAMKLAIAAPSMMDVSTERVRSLRERYPFLSDLAAHV
jgi:predicted amidohydrolase